MLDGEGSEDMLARPTVSVIVPTLNEEEYLPKLLECLLRQSYPCLEIIVADAGSCDHTQDIAVRYGCTLVHGGTVAEGRNAGAAVATGDFLCFMDSDVLVDDEFLKEAIEEIVTRSLEAAACPVVPITGEHFVRFAYTKEAVFCATI